MEKHAQNIIGSLENLEERRLSMGERLGRPTPSTTSSYKSSWIRQTYYTPPCNAEFTLTEVPKCKYPLFPDIDDIEPNDKVEQEEVERSESGGEIDDFGWMKLKNGDWYNVMLALVTTKNPYE